MQIIQNEVDIGFAYSPRWPDSILKIKECNHSSRKFQFILIPLLYKELLIQV